MTTVDLSRIPEVYRERVEREMRQAAAAAFGASRLAGDPPWRQTEAHDHDAAAVLARYLKIAAEAEGAAARQYTMTCAGGGYTPGDQIPETMRLVCEGSANAARAKVWADELAKLDARADPVADMRAEAAAARDPMAARMMSMTAAAWEKAAERNAPAEEGPLCEWGLCREPLSAPPRDGCGARGLHATPAPRSFRVRFTGEDDAARLYGVLLGMQINFPRAIGVLGDRLEPILEALRGPAAPEVEEVPPELAADAVQAVRAAQRAHLDSTRAVEIATRAIVEEVGCDAEEAGSTAFAVIEALNGAGWDPIGGRPVSPDPAAAAAFTGTARTEARLDIADATGLRVALDGLLRYLADKPAETVRTIAALVQTLPHGLCPSVTLAADNRHAFDMLAALPGAEVEERDIPPSTSVWVVINGVDFGAAVSRRTPAVKL